MPKLQAPFPYFGGKSRIAAAVWERFGDTTNYIEPFFGSGAVLLGRPHWSAAKSSWFGTATRVETVNDADGLLCNFWRALMADPGAVAQYADWPVSECDLTARHLWLVNRRADLTERLMGDPDWYDVKAAGWWVWGLSNWIGSGWCAGSGSWISIDGKVTRRGEATNQPGVFRKRVHLHSKGLGINSGEATNQPGVQCRLVHLGRGGVGIEAMHRWDHLAHLFERLATRLRRVRVACGDWSRIVGPSVTSISSGGIASIFLDPPYLHAERTKDIYARDDDVAQAVRAWALAHGDDPLFRIALCGYESPDYEMPAFWECMSWTPIGGYASQGNRRGRENRGRERVWFSPHCLPARQKRMELFDVLVAEE